MFEKLKSKLDQGVATVNAKSESLVETTRTKSNIAAKQRQSEQLKTVLGSRVYDAWRAGNATIEMFNDDFKAIAEIDAEIDSLNDYLKQIKENETQALSNAAAAAASTPKCIYCPNCGKALPTDCRFCDVCGSPLT